MQQPNHTPALIAPSQPRTRRRLWPWLLIALVVVCTLGFVSIAVSGPYRTLKGLQSAIALGDTGALNEYVDFPTLRQNLKHQINTRANAQVNAALPSGILSQLAAGIANSVVDTTVESLVTPAGLNKLVLGASIVTGQPQGEPGGTLAERFNGGGGAFEATDRFVYTIKPTTNRELTLILTRTGLTWRLTNVLLPVET